MACLKRRGETYYAQYYVGNNQRRISLHTNSLQIAKEKLRQIESALYKDEDLPLPTRTSLLKILTDYIEHIKTVKTHKSAQTDFYYLKDVFGPLLKDVRFGTRPPRKNGASDRRRSYIEANHIEKITTTQISSFISKRVKQRNLAPKTANRYREILTRVFNWSITQRGVKFSNNTNPAARVERYKEPAPKINFLTLPQVGTQLDHLKDNNMLQTMVAAFIYAGLRRSEALWLTIDDLDLSSGPYGLIRIRGKEIGGECWEPKTKVNRVVPISSSLRHYLDRYQRPETDEPWLFLSPRGKRWDADNFSQKLSELNQKENLSWSCLVYRHTFGSLLAIKGESLYKISTLMGNSPEICRRHYAALIPEELHSSVEFK